MIHWYLTGLIIVLATAALRTLAACAHQAGYQARCVADGQWQPRAAPPFWVDIVSRTINTLAAQIC